MHEEILEKTWRNLFLFFAFTATFSVVFQNSVWAAVAFVLYAWFRARFALSPLPRLWTFAQYLLLFSFWSGAVLGVDFKNSLPDLPKYFALLLVPLLGVLPWKKDQVKTQLRAFTLGTTVCALYGIGKHLLGWEDRITSFSGHYMVFGGLLACALCIQIFFLFEKPRSVFRWLCFALLFLALLLTQTRGAWLGFLAGAALFLLRFHRKGLLSAALFLLLLYLFLPQPLKNRVRSIGEIKPYTSSGERWFMWKAAPKIARDYPFGVGQNNLSDLYDRYADPSALERRIPHLHNNFFQLWVQNGFFGLSAYLFWIFAYFGTFVRRFPKEDGDLQKMHWTFLCFFIASLAWGFTEFTFSHQFLHLQAFLLGLQTALWASRGTLAELRPVALKPRRFSIESFRNLD